MKKLSMKEYRDAEGLSNHALQIFKNDPASFIWSIHAPQDPKKVNTSDLGTALHTYLLEPELFDDEIFVTDIKGRQTKGFEALQLEHPDKIVLTELEVEHVKIMGISATCHPTFNGLLKAKGECEASIFVTCPETGLKLKIRPDKVHDLDLLPTLDDIKTTANLDDWRTDKPWMNPLTKFGYGFTAAFYLYAASIHFKQELQEYNFMVVQTSANLGRYPCAVFKITRQELIDMGFWDEMLSTLKYFKVINDSGNWETYESFINFNTGQDDGDIEITFDGGNNE